MRISIAGDVMTIQGCCYEAGIFEVTFENGEFIVSKVSKAKNPLDSKDILEPMKLCKALNEMLKKGGKK